MDSTAKVEDGAALLQEACARNVPVELHHHTTTDELIVARARILRIDEEHVYTDSPQRIGKTIAFGAGKIVMVYLLLGGKRYAFRAKVASAACLVALNAETEVRGMALHRPRLVGEGQRREDYRISLACADPIVARLHEAPAKDMNQCPLDAARFPGRVVDISRGGLCILVDASDRSVFRAGECFFVSFVVAEHGEIILPVELRHARTILEGEATRIGLKFLAWNPRFTRPHLQGLARFCVALERQSRRRAK